MTKEKSICTIYFNCSMGAAGDMICAALSELVADRNIEAVVDGLQASEQIKDSVLAVYQIIAEAESTAHQCKVEEIHFHEVGAMDAIADITAALLKYFVDSFSFEPYDQSKGKVGRGMGKRDFKKANYLAAYLN